MRIIAETLDGKITELKNIKKAVLTQSVDAPCDSLSVEFIMDEPIDEIEKVKAYKDDKLIFNGYCDCQKASFDAYGFEMYIYARSSACVLVDNQAEPYTFNQPSALSLFTVYAKPYGFEFKMDDVCSFRKYEVSNSTSLYGAINNLASMLTGNKIRINPYNEIELLKLSEKITDLKNCKIISAKSVINRSEVISSVHFKKDLSLTYDCHAVSNTSKLNKFSRQRYVNLANLAPWQRNYKISNMFKNSFKNYKSVELVALGYIDGELFNRFSFDGKIGKFDDYILDEKVYSFDSNGEKTKLKLRKNIDIDEVEYVD